MFKDTQAECIYNKLLNLSGGFKNAIQKFDGEFPVNHLHFLVSYDLPANVNGRTYPSYKFITVIVLNGNNFDRPNLSIARTIVHETIHVEMFRKLLSIANKNGEISISELEKNLIENNFSGIFDYYTRYVVNNFLHEQMEAHYREILINVLKQVDPNQSNEIFEALSLEGLIGRSE